MKALISYNDIHREELYFFPRVAFRELLLNALIHKDYTQPYPVQIQIFRDKIDIWNIGEMPKTVQIKDLYQRHPSVPRNPKIADIFFKCGFVENVAGTEQVTDQVSVQVTDQVKKLITCLKGKTLSKKEILVALDMKHRPTLEQDYIKPALELGLIEMTQPDSPRSPTQKYRLTKKGKSL